MFIPSSFATREYKVYTSLDRTLNFKSKGKRVLMYSDPHDRNKTVLFLFLLGDKEGLGLKPDPDDVIWSLF